VNYPLERTYVGVRRCVDCNPLATYDITILLDRSKVTKRNYNYYYDLLASTDSTALNNRDHARIYSEVHVGLPREVLSTCTTCTLVVLHVHVVASTRSTVRTGSRPTYYVVGTVAEIH